MYSKLKLKCGLLCGVTHMQTFAEAERHHWRSLEDEWEREKEKILNSLLGSSQELEVPSESKVGVIYIAASLNAHTLVQLRMKH